MICILAGNRHLAEQFAASQDWKKSEFFYGDERSLLTYDTYHIYRHSSFFELPFAYWSRIEELARSRQRYR